MAPVCLWRDDSAHDVRTILEILKDETGTEGLPVLENLRWSSMPRMSDVLSSEMLEVGELNGNEVYAYLRKPVVDDRRVMTEDLIGLLTREDNAMSSIEPSSHNEITYFSPFEHMRYDPGKTIAPDGLMKTFMVACFGLRGHTRKIPLKLRPSFREDLIIALGRYKRGRSRKGKGRGVAEGKAGVSPHFHDGHSVNAIREYLQSSLGFSTLSYLDDLEWEPTTVPGASVKLRIGTCRNKNVFAFFDPKAQLSKQLSIMQGDGLQKRTEIWEVDMVSVLYSKPYSYIEIGGRKMTRSQNKTQAQVLRTYINGLFALRGHSAGQSISVDLESFAKSVSTIRETGYGSAEIDVDAERSSLPNALADYDSDVEVVTPLVKSVGSSTARGGADISSRATSNVQSRQSTAETGSSETSPISLHVTRSSTTDSSQASEDNTIDLGIGGSNRLRGWTAVNGSVQKSNAGRSYGMFSGASLPCTMSKIVCVKSKRLSGNVLRGETSTKVSTLNNPPRCTARTPTVSPTITAMKLNTASESSEPPSSSAGSDSAASPTHKMIYASSAEGGALVSDSDSVMGDDIADRTPTPNILSEELLKVMRVLGDDTSNKAQSEWVHNFITITTCNEATTEHGQQLQAYNQSILKIQLQIDKAKAVAKKEEDQVLQVCDEALKEIHPTDRNLATILRSRSKVLHDAEAKSAKITTWVEATVAGFQKDIADIEAKKATLETGIEHAFTKRANAKKRKAQIENDGVLASVLKEVYAAGQRSRDRKKRKRA